MNPYPEYVVLSATFESVDAGKIYVSKPLKLISAPQLLLVRPFAVVAGQRTNILLRGRNLRRSGAR